MHKINNDFFWLYLSKKAEYYVTYYFLNENLLCGQTNKLAYHPKNMRRFKYSFFFGFYFSFSLFFSFRFSSFLVLVFPFLFLFFLQGYAKTPKHFSPQKHPIILPRPITLTGYTAGYNPTNTQPPSTIPDNYRIQEGNASDFTVTGTTDPPKRGVPMSI